MKCKTISEIKLKYGAIVSFYIIVSTLPFLLYFHPPDDTEEWSMIEIKETFISKETYNQFRDDYSSAEFGWKIDYQNKFMGRIDLYGKFYIPVKQDAPVKLVLIERDIFSDDIVASVELKPLKYNYKLNNDDFVTIARESYFPDANSGSDNKPENATRISKSTRGTVDFLSGDYTDYIKTSHDGAIFLVYTQKEIVEVSSPVDSECVVYPGPDDSTFIYLADCPKKGDLLRIRGLVGSGQRLYNIFYASGSRARGETTQKLFSLVRKENSENLNMFNAISDILKKAMPDEARAVCIEKKNFNLTQKQLCDNLLEKNHP